jgi:SecD/SecF fusion protein
MKKSKGIMILLLALLVIIGAGYYGARIVQGTTGNEKYEKDGLNLGLDLAGGVSITYEVVGKTPTQAQLDDTIYKLQKRLESSADGSITEPEVYQQGNNRINADIPGATDEIFKTLQEPGVLEFRDPSGKVVFTGDDIKDAQPATGSDQQTGTNESVVELTLTPDAKDKFGEYTAAHIGEVLAIYYNDEAISKPTINGAITGGTAQITGMKDFEEAKALASSIRIGTLDLELKQLQAKEVSAKLGATALETSLIAAGIGIVLVIIFMTVMYLIPGLASGIALIIYTALVLLTIKAFGITLTLPGIAGVILSIGMAVDANVIIFARIREEIASGKTVQSAMKIGFEKATSAVVDGNVTTFIAAVVLGFLGSGSVKGFAYTLGIGIVLSMFTAMVITRFILKAFYALGIKDPKFYGKQVERKPIDFVGKKAIFIAIAVLTICSGFVALAIHSKTDSALNYSLEFVGGTTTNVSFNEDFTVEEIEKQVVPVFAKVSGSEEVQTQKVNDTKEVVFKTILLDDEQRAKLNDQIVAKFGVDEKNITFESISSTVSSETRMDAVIAVLVSLVFMLIYIWIRFKDIRFSASAIVALVHDVLVVLAFYAIARVGVGNTFIACMLTIVGYCINATIVIFDRIRENMGGSTINDPERLKDIVNRSITQTLSRSFNTSITTLITITVVYFMGVQSIKEFALPLIVGIISGLYSSVLLTGSMWYIMKTKFNKKSKVVTKKR